MANDPIKLNAEISIMLLLQNLYIRIPFVIKLRILRDKKKIILSALFKKDILIRFFITDWHGLIVFATTPEGP